MNGFDSVDIGPPLAPAPVDVISPGGVQTIDPIPIPADPSVTGVGTGSDPGSFLSGLDGFISSLGTGFAQAYTAFNAPSRTVAGTGTAQNNAGLGTNSLANATVGSLFSNPLTAGIIIFGIVWGLKKFAR